MTAVVINAPVVVWAIVVAILFAAAIWEFVQAERVLKDSQRRHDFWLRCRHEGRMDEFYKQYPDEQPGADELGPIEPLMKEADKEARRHGIDK